MTEISLIVSTRNRAAKLGDCLSYMREIRFDREWELIVVDNGSTDDTTAVVQEFASTVPFSVHLVREVRPDLAHARNAGIAVARGAILAFTDDGCYPAPDFLTRIWEVFQDVEVDYPGGRILLYDPDDAAITMRIENSLERIEPGNFVAAGSIQGANMAFRRSLVGAIGPFDPRFGPGAYLENADDVEFIARASAAGFSGGYFPGPVVYHHHGRKPGEAIGELRRQYSIGWGAYYAKFLLGRETAGLYARSWLRLALRRRNPELLLEELRGATRYLVLRLRERAGAVAGLPDFEPPAELANGRGVHRPKMERPT